MPTPIPTKMSQFENVSSLSTASYIIGLDVNGGELKNIKISGSAAGYELSRTRWILNPPVTSSTDTRGADGAESYGAGQYWVKSGSVWLLLTSTGSVSGGTISSSAQLVNGGGNSFDNSQQVTFNFITASLGINAPKITSSILLVDNSVKIGTSVSNTNFITGSLHVSGSIHFNGDSVSIRAVDSGDGLYFKNAAITFASLYRANSRLNFNLGTDASNGYTFGTISTPNALTISDTGVVNISSSVGIGKSDTNAKLDIDGNAIISGSVTSTGGFFGSLTGTSSYTSYAKSNNVYNVKDFGATGDGTTNDTNAILLAISASQATRVGTVYFPDGTYMITGSLTLVADPQSDIALVGNGSNVSVIKQTANVNAVEFNMDNGGTSDQVYQVAIKSLGFKCTGAVSSSIYVTYGTSSVSAHENISVDINDVHILSDNSNYWSKGIVLESAWNFRITNSMIVGRPLGSFYQGTGLELRRMCVNGSINQSQFNFWNTGIFVNAVNYTSTGQNTEGLFLNQIYMVPVVYGVYAKGNKSFFSAPFNSYDWANRPIAGRIALLTLNGSHIDSRNSGSALLLENIQGHYISNNFLISDNTGSVIFGNNAHEGTFIGNTIFNAGSAPSIYIGGYSGSANIISGNVFRGGSTQVLLESSSIYNKVYGNVLSDALSITVTNSGTSNLVGSTGN